MKPRVSVVIASYNYGRYIGEALDSLCRQTFEDWEAVVVDDGSTDDTRSIVCRYLLDTRFSLITQKHQGQPRTKNRGILETKAPLIAFLDADDRWHPEKLERQVRMFVENKALAVCGTGRVLIDPEGKVRRVERRRFPQGRVLADIFRDNFICFSSSMVRRRAAEGVGLFDESLPLAIDYDWWLRLAREHVFAVIESPLTEYRVGHANLSQRVVERLDTALAIMRRFVRDIDRPATLPRSVVRQAFAETYRHRALVTRRQQPVQALAWVLRSLAMEPGDPHTWKALAAGFAPATLRRWLRTARGVPDWEARRAAP